VLWVVQTNEPLKLFKVLVLRMRVELADGVCEVVHVLLWRACVGAA